MMYRLDLRPDDNGTVLVTSPDFPPLVTFGDDEASAVAHAVDAIETLMESMIANREDIPAPYLGPDANGPSAILPLQTALKVELYREMRAKNLRVADLQRLLKWKRESVDRLLRLSHTSKTEQFDAAFRALGRNLEVRATPLRSVEMV